MKRYPVWTSAPCWFNSRTVSVLFPPFCPSSPELADLSISLEPPEDAFNASEDIDEDVLARSNILSCLRVKRAHTRERTKPLTKTTPTPAKTTLAGERICRIDIEWYH